MNAEELEIARRLVACKGWVWLPGMNIIDMATPQPRRVRIVSVGPQSIHGYGNHYRPDRRGVWSYITLDLDDDLTRLGVLAVVRRAWGDETSCVRFVDRYPVPALWVWEAGVGRSRQTGFKATELEALLAALEAAP